MSGRGLEQVAEGVATAQAITALVNQKAVDYSRPTLELTTHLLYRLQWGGEELRIYTTTHFNFKLSDFFGTTVHIPERYPPFSRTHRGIRAVSS